MKWVNDSEGPNQYFSLSDSQNISIATPDPVQISFPAGARLAHIFQKKKKKKKKIIAVINT